MKIITTSKLQTEINNVLAFIVDQYAKQKGVELVNVPRPKKLLDTTGGNSKIKKSTKGKAYRYASLSLMPNSVLCANSGKANCLHACLNTAGRGAFNNVQYARALKSYWLMTDPKSFKDQLIKDLANFERTCIKQGLTPAVRLNTISDWNWSDIKQQFPNILFIDYTKIANRLGKALDNEKLIFSYSAEPEYQKELELALKTDRPIAVVFKNGMPETFLGRKVIDGDISDIDNALTVNTVIGLKAKGKAKKDDGLFVVDTAELEKGAL